MPAYDILNLFHDGTTLEQNKTCAATSTTRHTTGDNEGSAVLDLKETGSKGLAVVMVAPSVPGTTGQTITAKVQVSDTEGSDYYDVASFPVLDKRDEGVYIVRFQTKERYARVQIVTSATTGNITNLLVFVLPWAFKTV